MRRVCLCGLVTSLWVKGFLPVFLLININYKNDMPKMKTNSGAKKRFKVTGTGKVLHKQAGKRHNLGRKSQRQIRNLRKSASLSEGHAHSLLKFKMPYSH